jgi:MFS family permease
VLLPSLAAPAIGLALLGLAYNKVTLIVAAVAFGSGFGLMYPSYTAYVIGHVGMRRRGAAFGAMLAAFDTGIGTGSTTLGWLIQRVGFRQAYFFAAGLALLALPYFMFAERRLGFRMPAQTPSSHPLPPDTIALP